MEKLIYKEEQPMRQSFLPWLIVPAWLLVVVIFGVGFYQQLYLGKQFGNEPMSNQGLLWSGIFSILLMGVLFIVLLSSCLITEIWTDGIRYRFLPFHRKLKCIQKADIASLEVAKYKPVAEFGGWGMRRKIFARKQAYNISGNIGLRIVLKNGRQIVLGTRKKDDIQQAVNKMMENRNEKYSL